jgi:hypothetical protein
LLTRSLGHEESLKARLDTFTVPREGRKRRVVSTRRICAPAIPDLSIAVAGGTAANERDEMARRFVTPRQMRVKAATCGQTTCRRTPLR